MQFPLDPKRKALGRWPRKKGWPFFALSFPNVEDRDWNRVVIKARKKINQLHISSFQGPKS